MIQTSLAGVESGRIVFSVAYAQIVLRIDILQYQKIKAFAAHIRLPSERSVAIKQLHRQALYLQFHHARAAATLLTT